MTYFRKIDLAPKRILILTSTSSHTSGPAGRMVASSSTRFLLVLLLVTIRESPDPGGTRSSPGPPSPHHSCLLSLCVLDVCASHSLLARDADAHHVRQRSLFVSHIAALFCTSPFHHTCNRVPLSVSVPPHALTFHSPCSGPHRTMRRAGRRWGGGGGGGR